MSDDEQEIASEFMTMLELHPNLSKLLEGHEVELKELLEMCRVLTRATVNQMLDQTKQAQDITKQVLALLKNKDMN